MTENDFYFLLAVADVGWWQAVVFERWSFELRKATVVINQTSLAVKIT